MRRGNSFFGVVFLLALLELSQAALAQETGGSVVLRAEAAEDVYLAGGTVDVLAPVRGDVVAAGGRISVDALVHGDVLAVGGSVTVRGEVRDDARVAGGEVRVLGPVADGLMAAGGSVTVGPQAVIGGRTALAGGKVEIGGRLEGPLRAGGGRIVLDGEFLGDVELFAQRVDILAGAVVRGNLRYRSPQEANIDPQAQILGTLTYEPADAPAVPAAPPRGAVAAALGVSLAMTGVALYLLFPVFAQYSARTLATAPWASLGLGLAVLAATPLVIVLLMVTLIGLWLGLMLAMLYAIALLAGFLNGVLYLGESGLRFAQRRARPGRVVHALSFVVALILVVLVSRIPFIGALAIFILLLLGLGALVLAGYQRYCHSPPSAAPMA